MRVPGGTTLTFTGEAYYPENITCPTCRDYEQRTWDEVKKMRGVKHEHSRTEA